jgi:hypothetical protein
MTNELTRLYDQNGSFTSGVQAQLDRLGKKTMASGMANLVNSGMAGTSLPGNMANKFAEETAAPALAGIEAQRISGLAGAYQNQQQLELQRRAGLTGVMGQEASYWANLDNQNANRSSQNWPQTPLGGSIFDTSKQGGSPGGGSQPGPSLIQGSGFGQNQTPYASLNLGEGGNNTLPMSLRSAVEPNWVTINGKQYQQDPNSGQWNIPLGMAKFNPTYPQGWEGPN